MRRTITVAIAAALTTALTLIVAAPAQADTLPIHPEWDWGFTEGVLDSLEFQSDGGIIATGWSILNQDPTANAAPNEWQVLTPDGQAFWWGGELGRETGLPRADVAAAHPEAGPNHGYRIKLGFPLQLGRYEFCAELEFEIVGCNWVTVTPEILGGQVETVQVDDTSPYPALRVRGWVSDSWSSEFNLLTYTVTVDSASGVQEGYRATIDRPDVRTSHPGVAGIKGFDDRISVDRSGIYTVCVQAQPYTVTPGNNPVDLGCVSAGVPQLRKTADAAITGDTVLGSTLTYQPAGWQPQASTDTFAWTRDRAVPLSSSAPTHPVTAADVGHTLRVDETALAHGVLSNSTAVETDTITIAGVTTERVQGEDRYAVAVANTQAQFPGAAPSVPVVYVASGGAFADALSAGPAAAAQHGALLLTPSDHLPDTVRAEVIRLHPAKIVVVGGTATVSEKVAKTLGSFAPTTRLGGADRFAVSRAVIDDAFPSGAPTTFVVTGNTYPDALSAGAAAGSAGAPVLLVNGGAAGADTATRAELAKLHTTKVTVVGGPASVSDGVAGSLGSGIAVTRRAGSDRYAAAVALNRGSFTSADTVYLATGLNFPDGLSASARAGSTHSPLYLVNGECVPQAVITDIAALHATTVVVLGGVGTMSSYLDRLWACEY